MGTLHIRVRVANKVKAFRAKGLAATVGRGPSCDLILPFAFLGDRYLTIERQSPEAIRARVEESSAKASSGGRALSSEWTVLPVPARISIPTPRGHAIELDVSLSESDLDLQMLRETREPGATGVGSDVSLDSASLSRFNDSTTGAGAGEAQSELSAGDWQVPIGAEASGMTSGEKLALWGTSAIFVVLIAAAFGLNRYRHYSADLEYVAKRDYVTTHIATASELISKQDYVGAKNALEEAAPVAKKINMTAESEQIAQMIASPAIRFGSAGQVQVEGNWVPEATARAWKESRVKNDPVIASLEQQAAVALQQKNYYGAQAALEQALDVMRRMPLRNHPRFEPVQAQLEKVRNDSVAAGNTAKGLVLYQGRWMTPEERTRLENTSRGLVEFEGEWMTPQKAAEVKSKGGTGKILFEGKWVTPDQKMEMQGYVRFEGVWMRPEERDAVVAKRNEASTKLKDEETAKALAKAEAEKAEKLKPVAYSQSQQLVTAKFNIKNGKFVDYAGTGVYVAFDEGWYIVKGTVEINTGGALPVKKTFFCKLRLKGSEWESETVMMVE